MASGFVEGDKEDEGLSEALRLEMASIRPNVEELVGGGVARGRRGVRRRRMAQFAAAGATFAVLGGVAYAVPWSARPAAELGVASGGPGGIPNAPTPTALETVAGAAPARKMVQITPQATVQLLIDQLPAGARTGKYFGGWNGQFKQSGGKVKPGEIERTGTYAEFAYFDRSGVSLMSLEVQWRYVDKAALDCPIPAKGATCDRRTLPDGSTLVVEQNREYPAGERYSEGRGPMVWSARLLRKDGLRVSLWENNAPVEKGSESRVKPPLTPEQLEAIVTSSDWQAQVDADLVRRAAPLFTPTMPEEGPTDSRGSADAKVEGEWGSADAKVEQEKKALLKRLEDSRSSSGYTRGEGK